MTLKAVESNVGNILPERKTLPRNNLYEIDKAETNYFQKVMTL